MFGVFHKYDVDGGFGDAVSERDLICVFKTAEEANDFVEKYEKPHVYDVPYCELYCGTLEVQELPTTYNEENFWWLRNETVAPEDYNNVDDDDDYYAF